MDEFEWWQGELADDIYRVLREKELSMPRFNGRSPQLHLRRYFVDLLATMSEHLRLSVTTQHLAIAMLDVFMDQYTITVRCLYICSICCLILAAKFEEKIEQVPRLDWINRLELMTKRGLSLSKRELLQTEFMLLRAFNWTLCMPTAANYVNYFLWLVQHEDTLAGDSSGHQQSGQSRQHAYMMKYMAHFLQLSLQGAGTPVEDHVFLDFRPSVVAAASVTLARMEVKLAPLWTLRLERFTGLTWDTLLPCVEQLIGKYNLNLKQTIEIKENPAIRCERPSYPASTAPVPPQQPSQPQQRLVMKLRQHNPVPANHPVIKPVRILRPRVAVDQEMERLLFCRETLSNNSDNRDLAKQAVCQQESGPQAKKQIDQQPVQRLVLHPRQGTSSRKAEHRTSVSQSSGHQSSDQQSIHSNEPADLHQLKRRKIFATVSNSKQ